MYAAPQSELIQGLGKEEEKVVLYKEGDLSEMSLCTKGIVKLPSCQTEVPSSGKLLYNRKTSWKFKDPIDIQTSSLTPL